MMRVRSVVTGVALGAVLAGLPVAAPWLGLPSGTALAQSPSLDDVVLANVNGEEITRKRLVQRLLDYQGQETLERLISRTLVSQAAKKANVTVSEADVDKRMVQIRAQFKNDQDFQKFLKSNNLTEEKHREELRYTLLVQKLALAENPVKDEELQQYDVRMIVAPDQPTAEKWVKDLESGGDFTRIATERSEDLKARKVGGRLAPFLPVELPDLAEALTAQKVNAGGFTRQPVKLGNGSWVLLKLERSIPISSASPSERDRFTTLVARFHMDQWLAKIQEGAQIQKKTMDQPVIAVVAGEEISRAQLVNRLLQSQGESTLTLMINRALLLQAAHRLGVAVTEAEADKSLEEFKARFKKPEEFEALLTRNHVTEKQIRDELRYTTLMERVALKESPITDADLTLYDVRMIEAPNKTVGEKWIQELEKGADFAQMAADRSQDESGKSSAGRLSPFLKIQQMDIWRALSEQKVTAGQYTKAPVLLANNSWVIVKLERLIPASESTAQLREQMRAAVTNFRVNSWLTQTLSAAQSGGKISRPVSLATVIQSASTQ